MVTPNLFIPGIKGSIINFYYYPQYLRLPFRKQVESGLSIHVWIDFYLTTHLESQEEKDLMQNADTNKPTIFPHG